MELSKKQILIVEDDISLNNGIALALKSADYEYAQAFSLADARERMSRHEPALIILDINLSDGNGFCLLKELREKSALPVIILTANDLETDIVTGLSMGADDYITKPFSLMVLRARVEVQLRKRTAADRKASDNSYQEGDFHFDFTGMEFYRKEQRVELSKTEQKLLRLLVQNKGQTLLRDRLVDYIWTDAAEYVDENALSVTVKRLRDKLEENPAKPKYIQTVYGLGYGWMVKKI